ncbi:MAG TPA: type I polyketide synthase, partial [Solirubrobacterales bacterium]|nr:type I polyketide synthase [Solirubrobacterales bacterium]
MGQGAKQLTQALLAKLQDFLATAPEDSRLAILTHRAFATEPGESPDPAQAALAGLAGSAASEHPGRFTLIDTDASDASEAALQSALASTEPQLALREGELLAPRLAGVKPGEAEPTALDPERTVLITGATGGLGSLVARHLVEAHGAGHLLLLSRSGEQAPGAGELKAELEGLGAEARIEACDVSDRDQLEEQLTGIDPEHPLGAVIHCAGALDDATVETASAEQLERVFAPKADAAWHLHELTKEAELSHFVIFSSAAGTIGSPGQANYAAANVFCDALAVRRHSEGLAGTSIAWGLWESQSTLTSQLSEADLARIGRSGAGALSEQQGLALFDAALAEGLELALALRVDQAGLRASEAAGTLSPVLGGLVGAAPTRRAATAGSLGQKLASLPPAEREDLMVDLLRAEVAAVLGHDSPETIDPEKAFKDLGFDSLAAVELRNRLSALTELRLAATIVFDYPTAAKLAAHLVDLSLQEAPARQISAISLVSDEPVAIVGMACRYPGEATSPQGLWRLVAQGGDGIVSFPDDRGWDLERLYDPDPDAPGTSYAREGGFLADAGYFDSGFFGISPREAIATDPQQRLFLQACWEALESGGIDPASLRESLTGVFAGISSQDYTTRPEVAREFDGYLATGASTSVASGRIAYALGLEGPAMTVDTACSSSLV